MITLDELFDRTLFSRMIDEKYIRVQRHPSPLPFAIVNYTEKAQFDRMWNEVTLNCRGLIFNFITREVVARGFKKFFNWDDSSQPFPPTGPCLRSPKMDGSLGILYDEEGVRYAIATRGSFASDQAIWATEKFRQMRMDHLDIFDIKNKTYLFEIIYPENRIVVDYGQEERLVLLDVLDTVTGKSDLAEFDRINWPDKVEKIVLPGFQDTMASDIPQGEEGFVFYWPQKDFRVKMKAAEYIELHRMIFNLSARSVWQRMGEGETIEEIAEMLPDEFHDWVRKIGNGLKSELNDLINLIHEDFAEIASTNAGSGKEMSRKEFAAKALNYPTKSYLFLLFDGKPIHDEVWKSLRPAGNIGIKTISEDVA